MEEKKYEVQGTVTISTEEYRDLITASIENEKDASNYRSKFWDCEDKLKKAMKQVEELKSQLSTYSAFVNADSDRAQAHKLYLFNLKENADE